MKPILLAAFLLSGLILPLSLYCQQHGIVASATTGNPLPGATVSLASGGRVLSIADENGHYVLDPITRLADKDTLQFSHVGHITLNIPLIQLRTANYVVTLKEDIQSLGEVAVSVQKPTLQVLLHYEKLSPMPVGIHSFGGTLADGKIYICGGDASFMEDPSLRALKDYGENFLAHVRPNASWEKYNSSILIYDIEQDTWKTCSPKVTARAYHDSHYYNGKLYSLGGKRLSTNRRRVYLDETIEAYDIQRDTVYRNNVNPHQSANYASVVYDGNIIVMGGSVRMNVNDQKVYSNKAYLFDLKTGLWYQLDDMPAAKEARGILADNTLYLVGGYKSGPLKDIESYNLASAEWKTEASLIRGCERPGLAYHAGIIYVFDEGRVQTYNTATKEVNQYMVDLPLKSAGLFCKDGKLIIAGGYRQIEDTKESSHDVYSISLDQFRKTRTYND